MSDINVADVTIHIDKDLSSNIREAVERELRSLNGVVSVHMPDDRRHLVEVAYDPSATNSEHILHSIRELAGHAELIGL